MRIEKWGFLLSYAIYLAFCIIFSLINTDASAVNTMIFAITIASTAFAISDIFFTKFGIDKKERESLFSVYELSKYASKFYMNKITDKYTGKKMVDLLMQIFEDDEDKLLNLFEGNISVKEKENLMIEIKAYSDEELTEFVTGLFDSDASDINEIIAEDDDEKSDIRTLCIRQEKKEAICHLLASLIAVLGLVALLIILTIRINPVSIINNTLTVIAFLSVIINLILKEYYKSNSLKKVANERKKIREDLILYKEN